MSDGACLPGMALFCAQAGRGREKVCVTQARQDGRDWNACAEQLLNTRHCQRQWGVNSNLVSTPALTAKWRLWQQRALGYLASKPREKPFLSIYSQRPSHFVKYFWELESHLDPWQFIPLPASFPVRDPSLFLFFSLLFF